MPYADTGFFLALMKKSDWLKISAEALLKKHRESLWTSPATLIELLLLAREFHLDPERLLLDVLELVALRAGEPSPFLLAARHIRDDSVGVFDSLHAAFCGEDKILSSDRVFDRLGLDRIRLEKGAA